MKNHKRSKHEGIRYPCDQCDYVGNYASNLKLHKRSTHEGIRYLCDQCENAATQHSDLKSHKKAKHGKETVMDSVKHSISAILKRKVNVRIDKLDFYKYKRIQNKMNTVEVVSSEKLQMSDTETASADLVNSAETEIKKEDVAADDPLETPVIKEESECYDLESKIEIVEDIIFKTESSDISEFINDGLPVV